MNLPKKFECFITHVLDVYSEIKLEHFKVYDNNIFECYIVVRRNNSFELQPNNSSFNSYPVCSDGHLDLVIPEPFMYNLTKPFPKLPTYMHECVYKIEYYEDSPIVNYSAELNTVFVSMCSYLGIYKSKFYNKDIHKNFHYSETLHFYPFGKVLIYVNDESLNKVILKINKDGVGRLCAVRQNPIKPKQIQVNVTDDMIILVNHAGLGKDNLYASIPAAKRLDKWTIGF